MGTQTDRHIDRETVRKHYLPTHSGGNYVVARVLTRTAFGTSFRSMKAKKNSAVNFQTKAFLYTKWFHAEAICYE